MKKLLGILVLGLILSSNVYGRDNPALKGVDGFGLNIVLPFEEEVCGINKQRIETAVKYTLSNSKIKIGAGYLEYI